MLSRSSLVYLSTTVTCTVTATQQQQQQQLHQRTRVEHFAHHLMFVVCSLACLLCFLLCFFLRLNNTCLTVLISRGDTVDYAIPISFGFSDPSAHRTITMTLVQFRAELLSSVGKTLVPTLNALRKKKKSARVVLVRLSRRTGCTMVCRSTVCRACARTLK